MASRTAKEKGINSLAMAPLSISNPLKAAPAQKSIPKRMTRKLQKALKVPEPGPAPSLLTVNPNGTSFSSLKQSSVSSVTQGFTDSGSVSTPPESRLHMALRLALTLLSLATSAWIPSKLAKDDIFLVCSEAGGQTAKPFGPFFAKSSRDLQPPHRTAQHKLWNAKSTSLLLGIVLLELLHGETLESQASWAESLDENGLPNEMTMFCGAFLWVGRAQKLMKEYIGEDLGGGLYEAIRKCICFDFDREDDFGDSRFAELVYREVVVPLEKCCPQF
ncbi:hypothetical protein COL922a_003844 [Colletotrichum nupharicola]|nr:hypothetical protein COL922a_003844 [Colletotrichum nupharicola]